MDALPYVDTLFKEYLLFRGFVNTLETFNRDLATDPGCGFQADQITELIFRKLIPGLDCQQLVGFLEHLNGVLYSRLDSRYEPVVAAVEADILRAFMVSAIIAKRPDKVAEFFKLYGSQLLNNAASKGSNTGPDDGATDWRDWFVLPYLQHPEKEARFQVYFSAEWVSLLETSFRNFLAGVMRCLPLPAVLRFNTDRRLRLALQQQVHALQSELDRVKQQLADATTALDEQQLQQQAQQAQRHQHDQQVRQENMQQGSLQHQQSCGSASGTPAPVSHIINQHKREASLGDWQQQLHARLHRRSSSSAGVGGQELQDLQHTEQCSSSNHGPQSCGSGLFELLPIGQQASQAAAAAVAGPMLSAGSDGPQHRHSHSRAASSGGISFDPEMTVAGGGSQAGTSGAPQQLSAVNSRAAQEQNSSQSMPVNMTSSTAGAVLSHTTGLGGTDGSIIGAASQAAASFTVASQHNSAAGLLSSSPVMSWSAGMMAAGSSSSGMQPRRTVSSNSRSTGGTFSSSSSSAASRPAGVTPMALLPGALHCKVAVHRTHHHQQAAAGSGNSYMAGVSCTAFSPSGCNVASACEGSVVIWSPPAVPGNATRHATVACGAPVSCVAWDMRADKLMLIGCAAAGGVRAWHADTRRVVQDVGSEPGFPEVVAIAASPNEPTFVVAANNRPLADTCTPFVVSNSSSRQQDVTSHSNSPVAPLVGRLTSFNGRSFKRSAVLALPDDVGLASLAYSSTGSQLMVGTTGGTALLFEPSSRSCPVRVWQVAAVAALTESTSVTADSRVETETLVQVLWRPCSTTSAAAASCGSGLQSGIASAYAPAPGSCSFLSLCAGVLCEWAVAGVSSRIPLAAVDIIAAAAAVLASQQPAAGGNDDASTPLEEASPATHKQQPGPDTGRGDSNSITDRRLWTCRFAVSPNGYQVAALAAVPSAGVLLLYNVGSQLSSQSSSCSSSSSSSNANDRGWRDAPQVLLQGDTLAGGGCVTWHPVLPVLVVGMASSSSSLTVTLN